VTKAGESTIRMELFDKADHAVTIVNTTTIAVGDKVIPNRSVVKMYFTEADLPDPKLPKGYSSETKPADRKFMINGKEVVADQVIESFMNGKLQFRSWTSMSLPLSGTLLVEDGDGKEVSRLIEFGRGK
jgi:hypothetical protein